VLTDDQSFWRLAFWAGLDRSVTPQPLLEAADTRRFDLFIRGETLNADLSQMP
jgi:hypothetical protein